MTTQTRQTIALKMENSKNDLRCVGGRNGKNAVVTLRFVVLLSRVMKYIFCTEGKYFITVCLVYTLFLSLL